MILHTCPICGRSHAVRDARAAVAYGRQFTCSPECESERRRWWRHTPTPIVRKRSRAARGWQRLRAGVAKSLHVWVVAATAADLVRTAGWSRRGARFR